MCGDKVNRSNTSSGAFSGAHFWKAYPPDLIQVQTHCSELAGVWLESFPTLLLSQQANGSTDAIISIEQRTVQGNQVPSSSRAKIDFRARTVRMV